MKLFNYGPFVSHAGKPLNFKINCDALADSVSQPYRWVKSIFQLGWNES